MTPNAGRKWWGWGTEAGNQASSTAHVREHADEYYSVPPTMDEVNLPPPRVTLSDLPPSVAAFCSHDKFERALHSRGCSFVDQLRNLSGNFDDGRCIDLVAFPENEAGIAALLKACSAGVRGKPVAVVPWGGGSSVSEGLGAPVDTAGHYAGAVCVDLIKLDQLLSVDLESLSVRVQGGMYGPALERALKPHGLTLRHYPQSFEFSTAGGWVATRGAGHFATHLTHIDDFVQSVRVVTPSGHTLETRRLPGSGAGPSEHRQYVGSEGIYGIITEVSLRVLQREKTDRRAKATVLFPALPPPPPPTTTTTTTTTPADAQADPRHRHPRHRHPRHPEASAEASAASTDAAFLAGARCVRRIAQSGLQPANLRLVDGPEAAMSGPGWPLRFVTGAVEREFREAPPAAMLLIGFEGTWDTDVDALMRQALAICDELGGCSPEIEKWRRSKSGAVFSNIAARPAPAARGGGADVAAGGGGGGGGGGGSAKVGDAAAEEWGDSFKAGGYRANHATLTGMIAETFETAVTWDQFEAFHLGA